jgi:hypothetical protein
MLMSDYITPVMHIDLTGESLLLILGAIFIGGLMGGTACLFSKADSEDPWGAFFGGFINGAINTAGLAAAIATGGMWGLAIAAGSGFVGGFLGNTANQFISYDNFSFGLALTSGGVSAAYNMIIFGGYILSGIGVYGTWGERFIQAIVSSIFSVAAQGYIGGVMINPIRFWEKRNSFSSVKQDNAGMNILLWR